MAAIGARPPDGRPGRFWRGPPGAHADLKLGFPVAAPAVDLVRSYRTRLVGADLERAGAPFDEIEREALATLSEMGLGAADITIRRSADMRYVGQNFEIGGP
jgi:N-methylhydantoinase A/oxoprolinase/acetone carboxylase beta subunit